MSTYSYIDIPNLPKARANSVIVDFRTNRNTILNLKKIGIDVKFSSKHSCLYPSIEGHPDMQIHHLDKNLFVCEPTLYDYYCTILSGTHIIKGDTFLKKNYPADIAYNVARVGRYVFHNLKYTDSVIHEYYSEMGVKLINVKQGYSKCSVCVLNENAIITSDTLIAKAAEQNNIETLYFNPKDILLTGMSHGLVGGICGKISENVLAVNGKIEKCSDGYKFIDFCHNQNIEILELNDENPYDIGSIIPY